MPEDRQTLVDELHARCLDRQVQDIARLEEVLDLARQDDCQVAALCRHFGEERANSCGHCTRCLEPTAAVPIPQRRIPPFDPQVIDEVQALASAHSELRDSMNAARFLCGITSPSLTKAKLSRHPLFGRLEGQPFAELQKVLAARQQKTAQRGSSQRNPTQSRAR